MTSDIYTKLSWLPTAPSDFKQRCSSVIESKENLGEQIRSLASYALDSNQLVRLDKTITKALQNNGSLAPLVPFKLGLISNATTDFIIPALVSSAARHGIALECVKANFDQVVQAALDPSSEINKAGCDAVMICVDYRGLPLSELPNDDMVNASIQHLETIRSGIRNNSKSICILQTIARPPETLFGNMDLAIIGTIRNAIDSINRHIADSCVGSEDILFDVSGLAETVGLANWHNPMLWNLAKIPFDNIMIPLYADHVGRIVAAMKGKSRRCLILDLDNTMWGGIIGDDGLTGILIGQGNPTGEAHLSVQNLALSLRKRGVVLAVSSKNNDDIARTPFQQHPEMLIKEEHLAVFQANWNDKATNIKAISEELSLGIDSMVFLDDNPFERNFVRETINKVAVPELPDDPALYARTLSASGYFESLTFSDEDRKRADFYRDNARRVELQKSVGDLDTYLKSLEMVITFQPFDEIGRPRIAQLISKSNQFNLTTRRYTEADVSNTQIDPNCFTLQIRLADKLGDNGMISVIICRKSGEVWDIDTWLMSCRVLGRKVEAVVLQEIILNAKKHGIKRLIGTFIPTDRNKGLVADHYKNLGFDFIEQKEDGTTTWQLNVDSAKLIDVPMVINRLGIDGLPDNSIG